MALLNILHFPDPRLRTVSAPVEEFDDDLRQLVRDLFETMYEAPGIGLAATQVDRHIRLLVMDVSEGRNMPRCLINPRIIAADGEEEMDEGCLSVPEFTGNVIRAEKIKLNYTDETGGQHEIESTGFEARAIQHEMDHLDGLLFLDRLVSRRSDLFKRKVYKK